MTGDLRVERSGDGVTWTAFAGDGNSSPTLRMKQRAGSRLRWRTRLLVARTEYQP